MDADSMDRQIAENNPNGLTRQPYQDAGLQFRDRELNITCQHLKSKLAQGLRSICEPAAGLNAGVKLSR